MTEMKGKRLLVLGGSIATYAIVQNAQEMGVHVIVADASDTGPAYKLADEGVRISTTDIDGLAAYVKNNGIDGIFCGPSEFNILNTMKLCEKTGLPFASTHEGNMHACGHDGHTAMALELAERVNSCREELPRNVLFVFQPAEETTGGAEDLCRSGIFEQYGVTRIFGLHLWPELEEGKVFTRPGPLLARSSEVDVVVTGKSVHLSRASEGKDAMLAGMDFLRGAYEMADEMSQTENVVLRFGKMTSGTVRNSLSGQTVLAGSMRTYKEEVHETCIARLRELGKQVEQKTGCTVAVSFSQGYPAVWNKEELLNELEMELGEAAPGNLEEPSLAAEDFSFYQKRVPGLFFFLGTGDTPALHNDNFNFDEAVLLRGADFFEGLAENYR